MHPMRNTRARQRSTIRSEVARSDAYAFFNLLTDDESLEQVEALLPEHRERLFPPTAVLSMFLAQALAADRSCQKAVNDMATKRVAGGLSACSVHTGAYCRARQRLPEAMVTALVRHSGRAMTSRASRWHWQGRPVRLVDGTTLQMPDAPANQAAYPQPRTQQPGLGFPICRLSALICLSSGAILEAATGPYVGKGGGEQALLRSMLDGLHAGDILLGDAFYATYFLLCELQRRGVDGVFEQYGARRRSTDFRRGRSLGARDHVVEIAKPPKPDWMSAVAYAAAPDTLAVRELRAGGKTLVTTMLCSKRIPKTELKALYRQRWHVELDLRNLKVTLGMDMLTCKTPRMVRKEIWVYLLAYNLIRRTMLRAALQAQVVPRQLSFKHSLQLCLVWQQYALDTAVEVHPALLILIAGKRVGNRPRRMEPRAIKRRPKSFPLLNQPRSIARKALRNVKGNCALSA